MGLDVACWGGGASLAHHRNWKASPAESLRGGEGERPCCSAVAFMVAGGGFEPPTFGLCDLTHLSMRVGLYLHPRRVLAIQSLRLPPPFRGLGSVLPVRTPTTSWKIERREV